MNIGDMVLPKVRSVEPVSGISCCSFGKLDWIECAAEDDFAAEIINRAVELVGWKRLPVIRRTNLGTRNRISLQRLENLAPEEYTLSLEHDTIRIYGGTGAGVFYGAQSLAQIIAVSAQAGGRELILPSGHIQDSPRFQWRGVMLDSARHFQPKQVIFELLDQMAAYKLNVFHWHFVDRQGWRPVFGCAPELAGELPPNRSYSVGTYSVEDLKEVGDYAQKRFIKVVPELEMPGHSAAVFRSHPELTCPIEADPYSVDAWEFCLGNPETKVFLTKLLGEIAEIFPDSPVIHIGGDEAGTNRWHACPRCQAAMKEKGLPDERALEHDFMRAMSDVVVDSGRSPMTWGVSGAADFRKEMIIQDWLGAETLPALKNGNRVVSSVHRSNYFDYPAGDFEPVADWQKKNYEFEPVPAEATPEEAQLLIGGEGCLWTESIPAQRVLPRAIPRMRALAEMLWTPSEKKDFADFQIRERLLIGSGLIRQA